MTTAPRTLVQMWNRPTAYEIVARHEDGDEIRLGFSERHTKSALLNAITDNNREAVLTMLGDWDDVAIYTKLAGWTFGPVRICFGRTEREIANAA